MMGRVLLFMPNYSGIYQVLIKNLEKMGYEVIYKEDKPFKYKGIVDKIINFAKKMFLNDNNYKDDLRRKVIEEDILESFNLEESFFDYVLIIHPSNYSKDTLLHLKKISKKIVAYHWEGFSRFSVPDEVIDCYDTFAVFDKNDYENYKKKHSNIILSQSFYFDVVSNQVPKNFDLLYIGADFENRFNVLKQFVNISQDKFKNYFKLVSHKPISFKGILIDDSKTSYFDYLTLASKSKCQIDIKLKVHNGLSLRFFEALYFSQKIITDNEFVKDLDFYNPNNILIVEDWNTLTNEQLSAFVNSPYEEIPDLIKLKYSFKNWFNNIMALE